jgi:hypothetical protein
VNPCQDCTGITGIIMTVKSQQPNVQQVSYQSSQQRVETAQEHGDDYDIVEVPTFHRDPLKRRVQKLRGQVVRPAPNSFPVAVIALANISPGH